MWNISLFSTVNFVAIAIFVCHSNTFMHSSFIATATFTTTAIITSHLIFEDLAVPVKASDWTLGPNGKSLLALQVTVLPIYAALYYIVRDLIASFLSTIPNTQTLVLPECIWNIKSFKSYPQTTSLFTPIDIPVGWVQFRNRPPSIKSHQRTTSRIIFIDSPSLCL